MLYFLYILISGFLAITFYQDYKYRAVSWFIFPLLFAVFLTLNLMETPAELFLLNSSVNFCITLAILGIISLYFSVKTGKWVNITRAMLGWGDILFLCCLCVFFSPMNYMLFYTGSLLFIVLFSLLYKIFARNAHFTIPLAGLQAVLLLFLLAFNWAFSFMSLFSDEWILFILYRYA